MLFSGFSSPLMDISSYRWQYAHHAIQN